MMNETEGGAVQDKYALYANNKTSCTPRQRARENFMTSLSWTLFERRDQATKLAMLEVVAGVEEIVIETECWKNGQKENTS